MRKVFLFLVLTATALLLAACGGGGSTASKPTALDNANKSAASNANKTYNQVNRLDFRNFNARQKITDDPSTIFWCTLYPPSNAQQPITVAFAGKITSSTKHPFPSTKVVYMSDSAGPSQYYPEVPSPDGMYGTSDPYEYGLDPSATILDQFNFQNYNCSTAPTTYQANQTTVVSAVDPALLDISLRASALIKKAEHQTGAARAASLRQASALLKTSSKASKK